MKLWVDDERPAPEGWEGVTSVSLAQGLIILSYMTDSPVDTMSLDHDLGGDFTTRPLVLWLCENPEYWPKTVYVHSANPPGVEWLEGMVTRYGPGVTR